MGASLARQKDASIAGTTTYSLRFEDNERESPLAAVVPLAAWIYRARGLSKEAREWYGLS